MVREIEHFQLTSGRIFEILADDEFYRRCPAYFFMRRQGKVCAEKYAEAIAAKEAVPKAALPALQTFVSVTVQMAEDAKELLEPLREYLESRLGCTVGKISLYYGRKGNPKELTF